MNASTEVRTVDIMSISSLSCEYVCVFVFFPLISCLCKTVLILHHNISVLLFLHHNI